MSEKHPIVAITGSSGAGTTTVRNAFRDIFRREGINAVFVEGDSFRRYDRTEMNRRMQESIAAGNPMSRFGPDANDFHLLENLFQEYSQLGTGQIRHYVQDDEPDAFDLAPGRFTPWQSIPEGTDLLFYEGLHGGVVAQTWTRRRMSPSHNPMVVRERRDAARNKGTDAAQYVDLLIGVVPVVNLEWIQKIHRDMGRTGRSAEAIAATILRRMRDYIHFIVPQFSLTDINIQRVPLVDTSNPFIARDIPEPHESMLVIRFREPKKFNFPLLLKRFEGAFMSRPNTMVLPGGQLQHVLEVVCTPIIQDLCASRAGHG